MNDLERLEAENASLRHQLVRFEGLDFERRVNEGQVHEPEPPRPRAPGMLPVTEASR